MPAIWFFDFLKNTVPVGTLSVQRIKSSSDAINMINTAIDQLRKERMIPKIGRLENNLDISDNCQTADQALLYNELIYEIKKLPPAYRAVLNMFVVDGYSHQEIATFLGISDGTSKSNLSRAREHLKKIIQKYDSLRNACNG